MYCKEHPLPGQDYEEQPANDHLTFKNVQKACVERSKIAPQQNIETKKRLSHMMDNCQFQQDAIIAKQGEEYALRLSGKRLQDGRLRKRKKKV